MASRMRWSLSAILSMTALWAAVTMAEEGQITVMNPRGIMPAIQRIPMAERLSTLDGKTIYIVDTKFANTKPFVNTLRDNLAAAYPATNWVSVDKIGGYMQDDPALWAKIKAEGDGAIILLGH